MGGWLGVSKKTIRDIKLAEKRVLVRVDFNVPVKEGKILDDTRMRRALPTLNYLREQGAKIILMTHLGRPKGQVVPEMSVQLLVPHLSELVGQKVLFGADCGGPESQKIAAELQPGQIAILENVRFYPGEEKNDLDFAKGLAALGEVYVNDAFGTAHRAHASTEGITRFLPAVSGFLMEKEISALSEALENPAQPFAVILGGAKVSDKITVIENLLKKAAYLLIGGAMAHTFLKAQGYELGASKVEEEHLETAKKLLKKAEASGVHILLPQDVVAAEEFSAEAAGKVYAVGEVPENSIALDIGPQTLEAFKLVIAKAKTIVWNGPLGVYEFPQFATGTNEIAQAAAAASGKTIIGGGDVVAAVEKSGQADAIYHISTGGGASLEFLEGKVLPGVAALLDK
jgi:phosphoglycerate kinase